MDALVQPLLTAAGQVGTPIALIAFLAALVLLFYRARLQAQRERFGQLARKDRFDDEDLRTIERLLQGEFARGLDTAQRFDLIKRQLDQRDRQSARKERSLLLLAALAAASALAALAMAIWLAPVAQPRGGASLDGHTDGATAVAGCGRDLFTLNGIIAIEPMPERRAAHWARMCSMEPPVEVVALLLAAPAARRLPDTAQAPRLGEDAARLRTEVAAASRVVRDACLSSVNLDLRGPILFCAGESKSLSVAAMGAPIQPRFIILHYTASQSLDGLVRFLTSPGANASYHVVIDRDGSFVQLVPFDRAAWHAGRSEFRGLVGLNSHSIGIALMNAGPLIRLPDGQFRAQLPGGSDIPASEVATVTVNGRETHWHRFTEAQLAAAQAIARTIARNRSIEQILGHCEVAPGRAFDPGPAFPLARFEADVLGRPERDTGCTA